MRCHIRNGIGSIVVLFALIGVLIVARWPDLSTRWLQETITPGEGVDTFRSPIQIGKNQSSDMTNFSSRQFPALKVRGGRYQFGGQFEEGVVDCIHVSPSGEVHVILRPDNLTSKWYVHTTGGWKLVDSYTISTETPYTGYSFADWYDYGTSTWRVFHVRHDGAAGYTVCYWTGSTMTRIAYATYPVVNAPMTSHLNRMFVGIHTASGNLGYSKLADPATWTSPDGGIIMVGSSDTITVLKSMSDRLFIGTDNGIYVLTGSDEDTFVLQTVSTTVSIPHGSMACVNDDVVYFTNGTEIFEYTASYGIRNITRSSSGNGVGGGFAENSLSLGGMATDGRRVYVSEDMINTSETDTNPHWYVFDIARRIWHIEEGTYNKAYLFENDGTPCFARGEDDTIYASSVYMTGSSAYELTPRIYTLSDASTVELHNFYNLVRDGMCTEDANWIESGATDTYTDATYAPDYCYELTGNGTSATPSTYFDTLHHIAANNYVAAQAMVRVSNASCQKIELIITDGADSQTIATQNNPANGTWYRLYDYIQITADMSSARVMVKFTYADAATANAKVGFVRAVVLDDVSHSTFASDIITEAEWTFARGTSLDGVSDKGYYQAGAEAYVNYGVLQIASEWISPAFQIRPDAKKTLQNVYITYTNTDASTYTVYASDEAEGTSFSTIGTGTFASGTGVIRIKVPISADARKAEYVRVKVESSSGVYSIINVVLDWRIVERAR